MKVSDIKMPFDCMILDSEPVVVSNPFSGASCTLTPQAVAVYDCIMGAQYINDYKTIQKGCNWFRKYFPSEYMVLLD